MKDFELLTYRDHFIESDHLNPVRYTYGGHTYYGMIYVSLTGVNKELNFFIMNNNAHTYKDFDRSKYSIDDSILKRYGYQSTVHVGDGSKYSIDELKIRYVAIGKQSVKTPSRRKAPVKSKTTAPASAETDAVKSVRFVLPKEAPLVFKTQSEVTFKKS